MQLQQALKKAIENWEQMKTSEEEHAEEDANRFEASFYELIGRIREWLNQLHNRPKSLEEALALPEIANILDALPVELSLPFETELDLMLVGIIRTEDAKYD